MVENKHHVIVNVLVDLSARMATTSQEGFGVSGAPFRFAECAFPTTAIRKADARMYVKALLDQWRTLNYNNFGFLVACSLIIACSVLPEEKPTVVQRIHSHLALCMDNEDSSIGYLGKFVLAEVDVHSGISQHRFDRILQIADRFFKRELAEPTVTVAPVETCIEAQPVIRKRRRNSEEGVQQRRKKQPAKKRKTLAQLAEGESDDEYTDGSTSNSDDEEF
jgi:hypothetical protein